MMQKQGGTRRHFLENKGNDYWWGQFRGHLGPSSCQGTQPRAGKAREGLGTARLWVVGSEQRGHPKERVRVPTH